MNYTILERANLLHDGQTYKFEGVYNQDTEVSFL